MDISTTMQTERERLGQVLSDLSQQKGNIEKQIAGIHIELKAIDAWEATRSQKPITTKRGTGLAIRIIALLKGKPLTRAQIIEALPEATQQSVSNSLSTLKKKGTIAVRDGQYSCA